MFNMIKNFAADESGAVTVDWVVLTAAVVGMGLGVLTIVDSGITQLGGDIQASLDSAHTFASNP
ncbi:MAG: hypothetical protein CSA68_03595 [Rhodobacterales bacterium]|nr:MAG: hypothetical protein CSA68_03595 [Rhodobacterales bacterium]